jgi:hypothetical protein
MPFFRVLLIATVALTACGDDSVGAGGSAGSAGGGAGGAAGAGGTAGAGGAAGADGGGMTLHCFASPGACGFPDPVFHNVGVPSSATLTPSGSVTITTAGAVIDGLDVAGAISIQANNVTVKNGRVAVPAPGCGTASTCGNSDILVGAGITGTVLSHLELTVQTGATVEHAVRNLGDDSTAADHLYIHGPDAGWYGPGSLSDSYVLAVLAIADDHLENWYYGGGGGRIVANHNTLFNPAEQTATVFLKNDFGDIATAEITNNLLAGGGYTLYGGGGASGGILRGPVMVTGNHFARCGGGVETGPGPGGVWLCPGGSDSSGYYPRGGSFGWQAYFDAAVTTWLDNIWDDDGSAVTGP